METKCNNIQIAEFMGFEKTNIGWFDNEEILPYYITSIERGNTFDFLKFHESWDWLMPVVEKIKDMGYDQELDKIDNVLTCDLRIDRLYNEVIEFIKYHNQQKDLPDTM